MVTLYTIKICALPLVNREQVFMCNFHYYNYYSLNFILVQLLHIYYTHFLSMWLSSYNNGNGTNHNYAALRNDIPVECTLLLIQYQVGSQASSQHTTIFRYYLHCLWFWNMQKYNDYILFCKMVSHELTWIMRLSDCMKKLGSQVWHNVVLKYNMYICGRCKNIFAVCIKTKVM